MRKMVLFDMLVNLSHVWLGGRQWIIKLVSAFSQLQHVVLVEVGEEIQLHTDTKMERGGVFL